MARISTLYPKSPSNVPEDLTTPSSQYQSQMLLVLFSLLAFFGFYMALLFGCVVMMAICVWLTPFGLIFFPFWLVFFLFLIKGFFKTGGPEERTFRVEITEQEHPKLYAFIEKLCEETNAPFPHRIFLTPEVNAAVFYNESVLSLFLPTPKNLLIGMGLVNVLTLSEFKAVLAHEFGHFSQNSMKLHRYVYTANRIIADMVIGRDWLDNFLERCKRRDDAGAAFGWVVWSVLWVFRKGLEGCFYGINFLSRSLSRQMEFNADLVAVSVTGSDAIVHALSRLDFATQALDQAFVDLKIASDHDLFTNDLFYHQNHAAAYLRRVRKLPHLGEPPPLPDDPEATTQIFEEDDESTPKMWETHPSCYLREKNAKEEYIRCDLDGRSPWLLFDDPTGLRERVTRRFYRVVVGLSKQVDLDEAARVQTFIDDERSETTYDPRFHGMYDCRPINPGKIGELIDTVKRQPWKGPVLANIQTRLYNDELKQRMEDHFKLREELELLDKIKRGGDPPDGGDTFKFRGKRYDLEESGRLLKKVKREFDEDMDYLAELDNRIFRVHYQMATELGQDVAAELESRYRFHMGVQSIDAEICSHRPALEAALNYLSGKTQLDPGAFNEIKTIFREAHEALVDSLNKADDLPMPALKNVKEGEPLGLFLLDRKLVKGLRPSAQTLTSKWIGKFLTQIDQVREKIRRVHFKSLGGILALQEKIGKRWATELASVPDVVADAPPAAVQKAPEGSTQPRLR
jgi:Zn-dependent protease with chaperone function